MPPVTVDQFSLVGSQLEQKFRVDDVVAEGGFGVVYRAVHTDLERNVALKVLKLPPDLDDASRSKFFDAFTREAKAIVRINHPNIVQVLDFGVSLMPDGRRAPWMALEWLDGVTLRKNLSSRRHAGGRTPSQVLAQLRPILEALAHAHDEGIAHRDLKPANMVLVQTRRGAELKLLDFGIAKVMEDNEEAGSGDTATTAQYSAFSLHYASPEQISATRTGPWTDVHAMGLILTEMLVDEPPYRPGNRAELFAQIMAERRATPAAFDVNVGAWEPVLQRALALRPVNRYKNAGELLEALWQNLAGAVAAVPPAVDSGRISGSAETSAPPSSDPVAFQFGAARVDPALQAPDPIWSPKTRPAGSGIDPSVPAEQRFAAPMVDAATVALRQPVSPSGPAGDVRAGLAPAVEPIDDHGPTTLRSAITTSSARRRTPSARWVGALAVAIVLLGGAGIVAFIRSLATHGTADASRANRSVPIPSHTPGTLAGATGAPPSLDLRAALPVDAGRTAVGAAMVPAAPALPVAARTATPSRGATIRPRHGSARPHTVTGNEVVPVD